MKCIIKNAFLLMWRNNKFILEQHDISVDNHVVCGLDLNTNTDKVYDFMGRTIVPSFFNIHCHLGEFFFRDVFNSNWNIKKYLEYTEKENNKLTSDEQEKRWYLSADFTINELLSNGIAGIAAGRSAKPCRNYSICNMCGYPLMNSQKLKFFIPSTTEFHNYTKDFASNRCKVGILLHSLYTTNETMLNFSKTVMKDDSSFFTVHISEDVETRKEEIAKYNEQPVNVLDAFKLLTNKTVLVHCGFTSFNELCKLAENRVGIAVCPISNHYLSSQMPNLYLLENLAINWCIATDGPGTGRTLSLTKQLAHAKKNFPLIQDEIYFLSITQRPAAFYDCKSYTGKIEVGTDASFNIINKTYKNTKELLAELVTDTVSYRLYRF